MAVVSAAERASEPAALAAAFAEAQRLTAEGLRSAVELGRAGGMSWRELAEVLGIPASTLHRQYRSGAAIDAPPDAGPTRLPAAAVSQPGTVPTALDRFVGRGRELADLPDRLLSRRLVSLVGPAGVGKTRLATEIAHRVGADYPGGVWWVRLSSIKHEWLIGQAVSAALAGAGRDAPQVLAEATRAGAVLLILDNCEHLLAGVARVVADLCDAAPRLRILTTSREALRAPGESILPVAPFPPAGKAGRGARVADAVRLFGQRARDVKPDFDLDAWVDVIAEICDRLDGLPLAIELAGRQSDLLTPDLLLRRLAEPLDVLIDADRQQSLRGAIQWSYDLLDVRARTVFARLCVLPDGFDEDLAVAVTAGLDLSRSQVWALLADLTRKSMIVTDTQIPGRFRVLGSLRAFGLAVLGDAGELTSTQVRLIDWLAGFELRLARNPWGDALTDLMNRITIERDTIRYALEKAAALRHRSHPKLILLLARVLMNQDELAETRQILLGLLDNPLASTADRAMAHCILSLSAGRLGDHSAAEAHAGDAVRFARVAGDVDVLTYALSSLMITLGLINDPVAGTRIGTDLIDMLRGTDRAGSLGQALSIQAWLLAASGDSDAACGAIREAIAIYEAQADQSAPMAVRFANHWGTTVLHTGAILAIANGEDATATEFVAAILTTGFHHHNAVIGALKCAAILAARRGEHERALRLSAGAARIGYEYDAFWEDRLAAVTASARKAVGGARANAAIASGRAMTVAQLKEHAVSGAPPAGAKPAEVLTPRQMQVARGVARGRTNAQIATELDMSERTVVSHLTSIRTRLDLRGRVEIAMWVARADGAAPGR